MRGPQAMRVVAGNIAPVGGDHVWQARVALGLPGEQSVREDEVGVRDVVALSAEQAVDRRHGAGEVGEGLGRGTAVLGLAQAGNAVDPHPVHHLFAGLVLKAHGDQVDLMSARGELAGHSSDHGRTAAADRREFVRGHQNPHPSVSSQPVTWEPRESVAQATQHVVVVTRSAHVRTTP
jgi:hypothetical protein